MHPTDPIPKSSMVTAIDARWPPCRGESGMGIKNLGVVARGRQREPRPGLKRGSGHHRTRTRPNPGEFIRVLLANERVHIVTFKENYKAMQARGKLPEGRHRTRPVAHAASQSATRTLEADDSWEGR